MGINFDALVNGPCMAILGDPAVIVPVASQGPGAPAYAVRGIFHLQPNDIETETGALRADDYTFDVSAGRDFAARPVPKRGDLLRDIQHSSYPAFLAGRVFEVQDTGDDGYGGMQLVVKEQVPGDVP